MKLVFRVAAVYNVVWGLVIILYPNLLFDLFRIPPLNYPFLMSGIGMFVAVYGYGYWVVAGDLRRYPQLVVIGLLGKTLGPIGWIHAVATGAVPARTLWVNVFNDLIWLPFFIAYLVWYWKGRFNPQELPGPTLYQRLLQEDFAKLPPVLQRFHSSPTGGTGRGVFTVECAERGARGLVARMLGLAPPRDNVPVRLQVIAGGGEEIWIRYFAEKRRYTVQRQQEGCLIEQAGPLEFAFQLAADPAGMRFHLVRCRLLKLPWPRILTPQVDAAVDGLEDSWKVEVRIACPLLGPIATYRGSVVPSP